MAPSQQGQVRLVLYLLEPCEGQRRTRVTIEDEAERLAEQLGVAGVTPVDGDVQRLGGVADVAGDAPLLGGTGHQPDRADAQLLQ